MRWDDRAHKWVYTLYNPDGSGVYREISYTPRNQVEPKVSSKLSWDKQGFEYRYHIFNGRAAQHSISNIKVRAPAWDAKAIVEQEPLLGENSKQIFARVDTYLAKQKVFLNATVHTPATWESFVNLKNPDRVVYGWLSRYIEAQPKFKGIDPGQSQKGFSVVRTELPGVGLLHLKGDTGDLMNAGSLPANGPMGEHAAEVMSHDFVEVPVLVPGVIVPQPYNAAELARRIKAQVNTWYVLEVAQKPTLDSLNLNLDRVIASLQANDKNAARQAATAIYADIFGKHPGMTHQQFDDDRDEHDAQQLPNKMKLKALAKSSKETEIDTTTPPPIHRIAARALGINLQYLLARLGVD